MLRSEPDGSGRPGVAASFPQQKKTLQLYCVSAAARREWAEVLRAMRARYAPGAGAVDSSPLMDMRSKCVHVAVVPVRVLC